MFRPYNFKSLLAWTAGSLAGNQAYYDTKKKQAVESLSAQLAEEYNLYKKNGGSLELEAWVHWRGSSDYSEELKKKRCQEVFGKFDPNFAREAVGSLSILNRKIEKIESAVRSKKFTKSIFEDIYIISEGSRGFSEYYLNTISQMDVLRNENNTKKIGELWVRFGTSATAAMQLQPALWETVQKEIRERVLKTPNLGIKLATWKIE